VLHLDLHALAKESDFTHVLVHIPKGAKNVRVQVNMFFSSFFLVKRLVEAGNQSNESLVLLIVTK
jgi:hypothetical protein